MQQIMVVIPQSQLHQLQEVYLNLPVDNVDGFSFSLQACIMLIYPCLAGNVDQENNEFKSFLLKRLFCWSIFVLETIDIKLMMNLNSFSLEGCIL